MDLHPELLAGVCFEDDMGMFVDVCAVEVEFSEAAEFIDDAVENVESECV